MSESDPTEAPRCRCGYTAQNPIVAPRAHYTPWGWMLLFIGISSCPRQVDLQCPVCGYVFATITDPQECNRYRYRG